MDTTALALVRAGHRVLATPRAFSADYREYFGDLLATYRLAMDTAAFDAGGVSFTDLVAALLTELDGYTERFDLAVMANLTPDSEPEYPMCFLNHVVARPGLAFGISEQGVLAPFTALRVAADLADPQVGPEPRQPWRALVFVLEQSSVLHGQPVPAHLLATGNVGVALVMETGAPGGSLALAEPVPAEPATVPAMTLAMVRSLVEPDDGRHAGQTSVVYGRGLAGLLGLVGDGPAPERPAEEGPQVLVAPPGRPCSGPWSVLAEYLPKWSVTGQRVLLADYDLDLGRLASCVIEVPADAAVGSNEGR